MGIVVIFVLCSLAVATAQHQVTLEADRPYLRVMLSDAAALDCCYRGGSVQPRWIKRAQAANLTINEHFVQNSDFVTTGYSSTSKDIQCGTLAIKSVSLNDTALYQCWLNDSNVYTHGTYLQVFKPMKKTINLSESTKNKILTAEGVLLLLCVLVPSATLLFKSKRLRELEKRKVKMGEEENIYQGLNLDDCCAPYDQIERTRAQGHYQDVGKIVEETEDIQLEKP